MNVNVIINVYFHYELINVQVYETYVFYFMYMLSYYDKEKNYVIIIENDILLECIVDFSL